MYGCGGGGGGVDLLRKGDQNGDRVEFIKRGKSKPVPSKEFGFNGN